MSNGDKPVGSVPSGKYYMGTDDNGKDILGTTPAMAGMTKREAFAMAAMQGAISTVDNGHVSYDILAQDAVEMANALLKALEEEE